MTKSVLVWHQFDEPFTAKDIQMPDLLRRQGTLLLPQSGEGGIGKGKSLHIKLKLIIPHPGQKINQMFQRFRQGRLSSADIQHKPAAAKSRRLRERAGSQPLLSRVHLPQRHQSIECSRRLAVRDLHPTFPNADFISLRRLFPVIGKENLASRLLRSNRRPMFRQTGRLLHSAVCQHRKGPRTDILYRLRRNFHLLGQIQPQREKQSAAHQRYSLDIRSRASSLVILPSLASHINCTSRSRSL